MSEQNNEAIKKKIGNQNIVANAFSDLIQEQHDNLKDDLIMHLSFSEIENENDDECIKMEIEFLEKINLSFENSPNSTHGAYAYSDLKVIDEFTNEVTASHTVFNLGYSYNRILTLIHELSHHLMNFYHKLLSNNGSGAHCLEFAMIAYCIQWRLLKKNYKHNKCFFNAYDIHEDIAFPNIVVNVCEWDSIIKSIEWNSFRDLIQQVSVLAVKIRRRAVYRN